MVEDTVRNEWASQTSIIQPAPVGRVAVREPATMKFGVGIFLRQQSSTPFQSLQALEDGVLNNRDVSSPGRHTGTMVSHGILIETKDTPIR